MVESAYLNDLVEKLIPFAKDFVPPGSEVQAVVHQWLHALYAGNDLFARNRGVSYTSIEDLLKSAGLYDDPDFFKHEIECSIHLSPVSKPRFTFIDLFAGVGGTRQGFERAGGRCVFTSEFDAKAQHTYYENYGEFPFGDITTISEEDIPDHDVLVAGFPCQPFSHAGLKLGIDDTRGTLFYDIARILNKKRPKAALLENVRGLISHDKGHTLKVVLTTLLDMGYQCALNEELIREGTAVAIKKEARKMVLRSKDFGVPQNRQRIYIVLWREDLGITEFEYPDPPCTPTKVGNVLEENPNPKYTISDRLWAGHQRRKIKNKEDGKGFGFGLVTPDSEYTNTISARYYKDGSEALIAQDGKNPRKITPREAARLQGFPEEFILNPSDVQAYKQFGNSVSVPVIEALAKQIRNGILCL